jgi:putative transposase
VALPTYQAFAATDLLDQLAVERMLAKLSSRRYRVGLEPVGSSVEQASSGTSKSAVSRRFVARAKHALAELLAQDLSSLDLVALMVDGIRVAEHCCPWKRLGSRVARDGDCHPLWRVHLSVDGEQVERRWC